MKPVLSETVTSLTSVYKENIAIKMKAALMLVTLAAVVAGYHSAVVKSPMRANLNAGSIGYYDKLLSSVYMQLPPANVVQAQDFIFRGNATNYITAVQATEQGYSQGASAKMMSGGIGQNSVTVRLQTLKGYGFNYLVTVWGR